MKSILKSLFGGNPQKHPCCHSTKHISHQFNICDNTRHLYEKKMRLLAIVVEVSKVRLSNSSLNILMQILLNVPLGVSYNFTLIKIGL